jgi:hypothetical protein
VPLDPALIFSLEFETTYGEVSYPKERFTKNITSIKENGNISFLGQQVKMLCVKLSLLRMIRM